MGFLTFIVVALGIICFLLMEHPIVFWCLFVPFVLISIVAIVRWLKN